ncbi:tRNA glutamyl-Q(34) synthetase GluQRS [Kaarinaea lacus]
MSVKSRLQSAQHLHKQAYCGRFAPSPTGPLHFGSLVAAVASYLEAKSNHGSWLLRVEDLDPPREISGAVDDILRSLDKHGLYWDETILFQSKRHDAYHAALEDLRLRGLTYPCSCSRKDILEQLGDSGLNIYPGTCRNGLARPSSQTAIRILTEWQEVGFEDRILGYFSHNIGEVVGDFVLRRADGWFAYQLAVVVDDAEQGITDVVRGSDLLDNTPRQIFLQQILAIESPAYAHLPVVTNKNGEKLSKQTFAQPIDDSTAATNLFKALKFLGQNPPTELATDTLNDVWQWALQHWDLNRIPKVPKIILDL